MNIATRHTKQPLGAHTLVVMSIKCVSSSSIRGQLRSLHTTPQDGLGRKDTINSRIVPRRKWRQCVVSERTMMKQHCLAQSLREQVFSRLSETKNHVWLLTCLVGTTINLAAAILSVALQVFVRSLPLSQSRRIGAILKRATRSLTRANVAPAGLLLQLLPSSSKLPKITPNSIRFSRHKACLAARPTSWSVVVKVAAKAQHLDWASSGPKSKVLMEDCCHSMSKSTLPLMMVQPATVRARSHLFFSSICERGLILGLW